MTRRTLLLWFAAVLIAALAGRWWQTTRARTGCSLDGNTIEPVYRVDLMRGEDVLASFCCVTCALEWPDVPTGSYWQVHDEVTGEPLDARVACFVESSVITVPSRAARTHVFRRWPDAMTHAAEYDGERIDNPFREHGLHDD